MLSKLRRIAILALALGLAAALGPAGSAFGTVTTQTEDLMDQGGGGVYAEDGVRLTRQPEGITIRVSVPVPQPNSYVYPSEIATPSASPEVFSGWAIVFNHPGECAGGPGNCGGPDLFNPAVGGGVFNFAGHPVGAGGKLVLTGQVGVGEAAGGPPGSTMAALSNPGGAEVHVAIAPHGLLDPAGMPAQATTPAGSPACNCWWVAEFAP